MKKVNCSIRTAKFIDYAFFLFLITSFISVNSCKQATEPGEITKNKEVPVIPGLFITIPLIRGQDYVTWRNPQFSPDEIKYSSRFLYLDFPYPNPTNRTIQVNFYTDQEEKVSIWLVKGRLQGEKTENEPQMNAGGIFANIPEITKIILINNSSVNGYTSIHWYGEDENGRRDAPGGFYRMYLKIGTRLFWRDILFARTKDDVPSELRHYLYFYE